MSMAVAKCVITKKNMIRALKNSLGVVSKACEACGISRTQFYRWRQNDKEFEQQVENVEEYTLDFVEDALYKQIREGNTACLIFYLKTRGKKRGYIEKQLVEHSGTVGLKAIIDKLSQNDQKALE